MKSKLFMLLAAIATALLIAGCGDDKTPESAIDAGTTPAVSDTTGASEDTGDETATEEDSSEKPGKPPKVTGPLGEKPEIGKWDGAPPKKLIIKDIKKGKGAAAEEGDTVSVQYVGQSWSNGQEFDASWGRGQPFEFPLGQGQVIKGWDEGVKGMKKGGRRLLVIPPDLGYGAGGSGSIAPNETLIFVVDLEKIG